MPSNACFANVSSIGVPRLRRVLRALAWLYPEIGYCQGTGMVSTAQRGGIHPVLTLQGLGRGLRPPHPQVAACLLLFLEEEDTFWMMCAIIEDLLPASYFSTTLLGVQTDQRVLRHLIVQYLPRLDKLLQEHDIGEGRGLLGAPFPQILWAVTAASQLRVFRRAVPDHAALVPHGLRQRRAHQAAAAPLGPVLLRGLPGALPDHTGHAAPQGAHGPAPHPSPLGSCGQDQHACL